jgi:thiol:disulfide interchange protein DsbD
MLSQSRRFSAAFSLGLLVLSLGLPIAGLQHDERRDLDASKQSLEPQTASAWSTWSPEAVDRALNAGEIVFIDFTAAWCVSFSKHTKFAAFEVIGPSKTHASQKR